MVGAMRMGLLLVLPSITAMKSGVTTIPSSHVAGLCFPTMVCSMICMVKVGIKRLALAFLLLSAAAGRVGTASDGTVVIACSCLALAVVELGNEIGAAYAAQCCLDGTPLLGLVPEEVLPLGEFFLLAAGTVDGFERVGMVPGVPSLGTDGHGCGGEVLHLLQMEVELLGDDRQ